MNHGQFLELVQHEHRPELGAERLDQSVHHRTGAPPITGLVGQRRGVGKIEKLGGVGSVRMPSLRATHVGGDTHRDGKQKRPLPPRCDGADFSGCH